MKSPILFIIFKREDTTRTVFNRIREARPPKLYIAADGPRPERPEEKKQCLKARKVVENVDWPCEVHHLYRDENMGCGKGVSSAISWFFEHEEQGIIIEDDILPHPDFFKYCDEMLEKYKDNEQIQMIAGCNYFYDGYQSDYSYYMSTFACIWGWATWRRVWSTYQFDVNAYPEDEIKHKMTLHLLKDSDLYFQRVYDRMKAHIIDTWDYQFVLNQVYYGRYSISPFTNMIENIGMGDVNATHTTSENEIVSGHKSYSPYPLRHPNELKPDAAADEVAKVNSGQAVSEENLKKEAQEEINMLYIALQDIRKGYRVLERKNQKHLRQVRILTIVSALLFLLSVILLVIML